MQSIPLRAPRAVLTSLLSIGVFGIGLTALSSRTRDDRPNGELSGKAIVAGRPVVGAVVSLYVASTGKPTALAHAMTSLDGGFTIDVSNVIPSPNRDLYVIVQGGRAAADGGRDPNGGLTLLTVLGATLPKRITINELTTVASAFTNAQFLHGDEISGNALSLRIAAGNVPNFVDLETGTWGQVLLDPINSTQTTALATLNTLASLISAYTTTHDDRWRTRFLEAATANGSKANSTLEAMANIARVPWVNARALYELFDQAYPQPKDGARRSAPFLPYLALTPPDFALMLCFAGGGMYAAGRLMFDAEGNLWSGQNWMPGSQSGVLRAIGGGTIKLAPNGTPLSPPVTGFTGMGVDGIGWGTGVTRDKVWVTSFNGKIGIMDFEGRALGDGDLPFKQGLGGLQGVGISATGDVWIADGSGDQLLHFPGGSVKAGHIVKPAGLKSPFDIVIDDQNRVWVSNSQSETVVRFPATDPSRVETFKVGIGVRALALDSKGNVWVASNMSPGFPPPRIPEGASIMDQFRLAAEQMIRVLGSSKRTTGVIHMIHPDGTQLSAKGFDGGGAISVPWGLNVDGNDNVWIGNFWGRSVALMAGITSPNEEGKKPGDVLHVFSGGSIQMLTDVAVDPAGNVWAANNWNVPSAVLDTNPAWRTSTWGGGSGVTVIYGVAAPVKPPRMGKVQRY